MFREGHGGLYKAPTVKEQNDRVRGEEDMIKFIDLRFERCKVVGFGTARIRDVPYVARS